MNDKIPLREAYLIALVLTSATIIVVINKGNPEITNKYFTVLDFLLGGILGYATQTAMLNRGD